MDKRQSKRENEGAMRFQEQQKAARDAEIRSRELFNNWQKENSKRQIMLLESIMATLDTEKIDHFQKEVSSRYAQEISNDIDDLDDLLEQKKDTDEINPELEANIESKIEEIESAKEFIEHFIPTKVANDITDIANSAKLAYKTLRDLPIMLEQKFKKLDSDTIKVSVNQQDFDINPENEEEVDKIKNEALKGYKENRKKFLTTLDQSIKDTISEVTNEISKETDQNDVSAKLIESVTSSLLEKVGLDKMVALSKSKKTKEDKKISKEEQHEDS